MLGSVSLVNKVDKFEMLDDYLMDSDHAPFFCQLKFIGEKNILNTQCIPKFNFEKANWSVFKQFLFNKANNENVLGFNEFNSDEQR